MTFDEYTVQTCPGTTHIHYVHAREAITECLGDELVYECFGDILEEFDMPTTWHVNWHISGNTWG